MKLSIVLGQPSTIRGLVWLIVFTVGLFMAALGKDVQPLLLLGSGVAGGLGVFIDDKS